MRIEREEKLKKAIAYKQGTLTVVMENVHDPHNISAVLRSCDAVGVIEVYIINSETGKKPKMGKKSSASAMKWLNLHYFDNLEACFTEIRKKYDKIYTTHLSKEAKTLHQMDFTQSVALVFGNEHDGVSEEAVALSDGNFIIPQVGLIQSLNISVACAVTLYEVFRQRDQANMYENPQLSPQEQETMFVEWSER